MGSATDTNKRLVKTTKCRAHDHREFAFYCNVDDPQYYIDWMISYFEQAVASGDVFNDGETVRLGWMQNRLYSDDDVLYVYEPDFKSLPLDWENSMHRTIQYMSEQVFFAKGCDLEVAFAYMWENVAVCNRLGEARPFNMIRYSGSESIENDSGWRMGCRDENHDHSDWSNLYVISLYEAAMMVRPAVRYMALPVGTAIINTGDPEDFIVEFDGEVLPQSMVEAIMERPLDL